MPCQSYDDNWRSHDSDRDKIKELKQQADMLARIACKALDELEANKIEDMLLLRDDEVRTWWMKHKEDDRKAKEAREAQERRVAIRKAALAKLSKEEKEVLGIAKPKTKRTGVPSFRVVFEDEDQGD
jgi:hypothetical protein